MEGGDLNALAGALRERLSVIADHTHRDRDQEGHLQRLVEVSGRIEALAAALPPSLIDPQLRHYLERRSYDKALAWIESGGN